MTPPRRHVVLIGDVEQARFLIKQDEGLSHRDFASVPQKLLSLDPKRCTIVAVGELRCDSAMTYALMRHWARQGRYLHVDSVGELGPEGAAYLLERARA